MRTQQSSPSSLFEAPWPIHADTPTHGGTESHRPRRLILGALLCALLTGCSSGGPTVTGPAAAYQNALQHFVKGDGAGYDKALDGLESLANANPPGDYTDRARVLRAVILAGEMEGYKTLSEAYAKGADTAKGPGIKPEYTGLHRDAQLRGASIAIHLGEVAMQLTKGGSVAQKLSLEAPYPTLEPPSSVAALDTVRGGLKIGSDDEAKAELEAVRMGVGDALAEVVGGGAANAKSKMNAGPVSLDSTEFSFFLASQMVAAASFYDKKHSNDPARFKLLAGIAGDAMQPISTALKNSPNPDQAKRLKKLQDQIAASLKAFDSIG